LFIRAAPGQPELPPTSRASDVWVVDAATLQRVADVQLLAPAFDATPTPDGGGILISANSN